MVGAQSFPNRHMSMESLYEYGSRAGVWRVLRTFERRGLPLTIFAVAQAMARNPEVAAAFVEKGTRSPCRGYRWLSYQLVDQEIEREHMVAALELLTEITGSDPAAGTRAGILRIRDGWSSSRVGSPTTPTVTPTICRTG